MEVRIEDDDCVYDIYYYGGQLQYEQTLNCPAEWSELEITNIRFISGDKDAFDNIDYDVFYEKLEEAIQ